MNIIIGSVDDGTFWAFLAQLSAAISAWAAHRAAAAPLDELESLTARLRHPVKWVLHHPVRAMKRAVR